MTNAMRKTLKAVFLIAITIGMAVALTTLTSFSSYQKQDDQVQVIPNKPVLQLPSKRVSRFLAESSGENFLLHGRSLKPADHLTTLTSFSSYQKQDDQVQVIPNKPVLQLPSKRVSRFLAESSGENFLLHGRSLKPADHCHKDNEVCDIGFGANFTCCGNKCFDLTSDKAHCGACHDKCKFTTTCCRGKCVDINYDKRHCGGCGHKCLDGQYCIYGMCDYA